MKLLKRQIINKTNLQYYVIVEGESEEERKKNFHFYMGCNFFSTFTNEDISTYNQITISQNMRIGTYSLEPNIPQKFCIITNLLIPLQFMLHLEFRENTNNFSSAGIALILESNKILVDGVKQEIEIYEQPILYI